MCEFKGITFPLLETAFPACTANLEDVPDFKNLRVRHMDCKTYKEMCAFYEANSALVLLFHLDFYYNPRKLAKGNFMVFLSVLPSKPRIKEITQ